MLFVGNSYTYFNDLPGLVRAIDQSSPSGAQIKTEMLVRGGASLRDHLATGELQRLLDTQQFDLVVLQELGGYPLCSDSAHCDACSEYQRCVDSPRAIKEAIALVRKRGARVVLYGTWSQIGDFQVMLTQSLGAIARETGAGFADTGAAMEILAARGRLPVWDSTGHPLPQASLLAAMVISTAISGGPQRGLPAPSPDPAPSQLCGPDWTRIKLSGTSLASQQTQPPSRCFAVTQPAYDELRKAAAEAGSGNQRTDQQGPQ